MKSSHRGAVVVVPILAAAAVCLVLLGLSWPTLVAKPQQVPVAITGQPELVQRAGAAITAQSRDAIDLIPVADRAAAITKIRQRDAVGAIVLDPAHPEVITAAAAGPGPQQLMSQLGSALQRSLAQQSAAAPTVAVTDVVPYSADDPTGGRLAVAALPLALGGVLGGALLSIALVERRSQLIGLVGYALVAGFGLAAILGPWYGALPGSYVLSSLALALVLFAVASVVVGLYRLIGRAGIAVGALVFVLGATPISGSLTPREFLPDPWRDLGQWLPQGAGSTLVRDLSYFPDASTTFAWLVPAGWALLGIVLIMLAPTRTPAPVTEPQPEPRPADLARVS
jgi:hypothetical protein